MQQDQYVSLNGTTLVSASDDKTIRLWDVKTGQQKAKLDGNSDFVRSVCFSPNGTVLASGNYDKSIRLWDVKTRKKKAKLEGPTLGVNSFCFSFDDATLASRQELKICSLQQKNLTVKFWTLIQPNQLFQQKLKIGKEEYSYISFNKTEKMKKLTKQSAQQIAKIFQYYNHRSLKFHKLVDNQIVQSYIIMQFLITWNKENFFFQYIDCLDL